jgi:hypothetical protein
MIAPWTLLLRFLILILVLAASRATILTWSDAVVVFRTDGTAPIVTTDGGCTLPNDGTSCALTREEEAYVAEERKRGRVPHDGDLVFANSLAKDCSGQSAGGPKGHRRRKPPSLWHFLTRCLAVRLRPKTNQPSILFLQTLTSFFAFHFLTLLAPTLQQSRVAILNKTTGAHPDDGEHRAALVFFEEVSNPQIIPMMRTAWDETDPCRFSPFLERWRPFLEQLFADGAVASVECARKKHGPARAFRTVVAASRTPVHDPPKSFREIGFRAFGVEPPRPRALNEPIHSILHLTRFDDPGTRKAHRTIADDAELEAAFRRAGASDFSRCCDWQAPNATATAIAKVASADVVVGMHGAAFTHLIWAKKNAVLVELYSHSMCSTGSAKGLWFFRRGYTSFYGGVCIDRDQEREVPQEEYSISVLNGIDAGRVVRCANESMTIGHSQPSCDFGSGKKGFLHPRSSSRS